jgi:VanZ family protein
MLGRWALVAAWMAVVFAVSSLSRLGMAERVPDVISHPIEYGIGAVLILRAIGGPGRAPGWTAAVGAVVLATLYGVTDEYHQSFVPGRHADAADVAKDLVGAAAGTVLYRRWAASARGRLSEVPPR